MDVNSLNKVLLGGWVGKVGELQTAKGSTKVFARLSLATNEGFKGDDKPRTEWHNLTAFGYIAKFVTKYLKPGGFILVEGKLRSHYYDKDGEKRKYTDVSVEKVITIRGIKHPEDFKPEEESEEEEDGHEEEEPDDGEPKGDPF